MKQKRYLVTALVFLSAGILFMLWDMFFSHPEPGVNPYAYDMKAIRSADTLLAKYREVQQIKPVLTSIHGLAVDRSDRIYIAGDGGVELYNREGKRESAFRIGGSARCIHVDKDGLIYLGMEDHLEIYNHQGIRVNQWKSCAPEAIITSIAVTTDDIYIADAGNKIVYRYDHSGKLIRKIGEKDPRDSVPGFVVPSPWFDLATDPGGALWVVNPGRHLLEKFSREGAILGSWGKATMAVDGFCGCCNPSHFALLSDGSFVTSEKAIERVKIYSPKGEFRFLVATPESFTEGTRGLDLAVDSKDRILVLDPERNQVRIFVPKQ